MIKYMNANDKMTLRALTGIKKIANGSAQILLIKLYRLAYLDKSIMRAFREACTLSGVINLRDAIVSTGKDLAAVVNPVVGLDSMTTSEQNECKVHDLHQLHHLAIGFNLRTAFVAYDNKHRYYYQVPYDRALKVWRSVYNEFIARLKNK